MDYGVETFCKEYIKTRDASDAAASLVFHLAFTLWGEVGGYSRDLHRAAGIINAVPLYADG